MRMPYSYKAPTRMPLLAKNPLLSTSIPASSSPLLKFKMPLKFFTPGSNYFGMSSGNRKAKPAHVSHRVALVFIVAADTGTDTVVQADQVHGGTHGHSMVDGTRRRRCR